MMAAERREAGDSMVGQTVLGRYRVLSLLARGGMGEVYLARSEGSAGFHRPVVVKRLLAEHSADKTILALFQREARIMATLRHPNIVSVLDFGQAGSDHVLAIEYVHGLHLGRWLRWTALRGERFPVQRALHVVVTVLDALRYAHEARGADGHPLGIVHRDVSPANVLLDVEGVVKLADFGVAHMQGEHTEHDERGATVRGKFPYLAPEIFDGHDAGPATDVYAAAVVLDECLRGENAFKTGRASDTVVKVLTFVPARLDVLRDDVDPALAKVVANALSKSPEARPASAAALADALRTFITRETRDARSELAAAAHRDFLDPQLAPILQVPPLTALEELWEADAPPSVPPARTHDASDAFRTAPARPSRAPPKVRRRVWPTVVAAALVLVAALIVALALPRATSEHDAGARPVVVVVDRVRPAPPAPSPAPTAAMRTPATRAAPAAAAAPPAPLGRSAAVADRRQASASSSGNALAAPFRARGADASRCFTDHVADIVGTPQMEVHFDVAADGTVSRATLTPAELQATALGRCLLDVARTTQFRPQPRPVSFCVPLEARRVGAR